MFFFFLELPIFVLKVYFKIRIKEQGKIKQYPYLYTYKYICLYKRAKCIDCIPSHRKIQKLASQIYVEFVEKEKINSYLFCFVRGVVKVQETMYYNCSYIRYIK